MEKKNIEEWAEVVQKQLPHLSKPQAVVLALWSFGMVLSKSCGLSTVSGFLAKMLGEKENSVRQRLREWYKGEEDKKGVQRAELEVSTCFVPLVKWVLSWWETEEKRLVLVMDASTLGQKFVVLAISIVYRGSAIPVAWQILSATEKGAWKPHWLSLFETLEGAIPADWTVVVMADRGLYARWLYQTIVGLGWHPFLRINLGGTYRHQGHKVFHSLGQVVPQIGQSWSGQVTCFKSNPLVCTLLACWDEGYTDPWLIVTDLLPAQADVLWYALRPWIECGFKQTKRAGWQWQYTRMTDPQRANRLWLALAVATLWVLSVGGEAETTLPASSFEALPPTHIARRLKSKLAPPRSLSCFRNGILTIIAALLTDKPLPLGRFFPEPWPSSSSLSPPS